uniref:gpW family head-tail joining protein n=1 Tax=Xanthomonas albilineans TaxID=29447 RepID=UPI0027DE6634|nr:gpW family head-tail joining protein [Xanthomonas albilineans]
MDTLQQQLDEALAARHAWCVGRTRVTVTFGDRTLQYSGEGMKQLDAYIALLRRQINGVAPVRNRVRYMIPD